MGRDIPPTRADSRMNTGERMSGARTVGLMSYRDPAGEETDRGQ